MCHFFLLYLDLWFGSLLALPAAAVREDLQAGQGTEEESKCGKQPMMVFDRGHGFCW